MPSDDVTAKLERLTTGFRERYLSYEELTHQLQRWAEHFPELVRLESLGQTAEKRELWLLTVGSTPQRRRPAVWIDGNMHATELAGSSVALAIAEDAIRLHLAPDTVPHDLPSPVADAVRDVIFHVMPRVSPDGAEQVLASGRYVRSVPRDHRLRPARSRWIGGDVDGDGLALSMRVEDPTGEYVESRELPGLMVLREIEDEGPFYKIYPEGHIEHFDGSTVPSPDFLGDNSPDLNRNFPHAWVPEHRQKGAGAFPASELESRVIVEFATEHPNLFAWFNLHTFGGVYIRPLGDAPDTAMAASDLALYRQIEAWAQQLSGYPTVSGYEEFTYEPGKPLCGDLTDFAYHQRGCLALVCELWDLFAELGIERRRPFVDHYTHITCAEMVRLGRWDEQCNASRVLRAWRRCRHPQLGSVEVGGLDPRIGVSNPPYERLAEICAAQSALWLRVASLAPRVEIVDLDTQPLGDGHVRLDVTVANLGYLPTYVLDSARALTWNEPLYAELTTVGAALTNPAEARRKIGHLDGWGRGRFSGADSLFDRRSRGSTARRSLSWIVNGRGTMTVKVGGPRTGWIERSIAL